MVWGSGGKEWRAGIKGGCEALVREEVVAREAPRGSHCSGATAGGTADGGQAHAS